MAATNYMDAVNGNDAYNGRAAAAVLSGFAAVNATTILLP